MDLKSFTAQNKIFDCKVMILIEVYYNIELAQDPGFKVAVDYHWWRHHDHHEEVGEGQVDHEHVGGCAETSSAAKNVDHHPVACPRDDAQHEDDEAQNAVPQRIQRRKLVPFKTKSHIN